MSPTANDAEARRWLEAFDAAWDDPIAVPEMSCPTCGQTCLHFVYIVDSFDREDGMFAFWCDACWTGLAPGFGPLPGTSMPQRRLRGTEQVADYRIAGQPESKGRAE